MPARLDVLPSDSYGLPYEDHAQYRCHGHGSAQARGGAPGRTMSELVETALRNLFRAQKERRGAFSPAGVSTAAALSSTSPTGTPCTRPWKGASACVVDTNILVYAADADSPWHAQCSQRLERQRTALTLVHDLADPVRVLRVTTHPRVMRRPWSAPARLGVRRRPARLAGPRGARPDRAPRAMLPRR